MAPLVCPLALLLLLAFPLRAPAASVRPERLAPSAEWALTEFVLRGIPAVQNPFDPAELQVDAEFTAPSGATITLPAFWFQDHQRELVAGAEQLQPVGEPQWRVRYRPTEPGEHTLRIRLRPAATTTAASPGIRFNVAAASTNVPAGWVRVAEDRRSFVTSEGQPLLFAGHNLCWPTARGTFDYDAWFAQLEATGQNFARLWLAPWWAPLEHLPGTLTNFRLDAAWQLDQVFAAAERHGIYLMLCLDHHGMYQPFDPTWGGSNAFWTRNPYSHEQGGPCAVPADFFRLPEAKAAYQKRLRYLIARYSHSPVLMAWQFFNEIDNVFDRAPVDEATVVAWHVEMAQWLRAQDPYQHVISTSLTGGVDRPAFWHLPEMEFSSYHAYWEPAPARRLGALSADFATRYDKPALIGEFGVNGGHWDAPADPHLRGFRQHMWGSALGGSASIAFSWWWEDLHADGALRLEEILTTFLRELGWFEGGWSPATLVTAGRPPTDLGEPDAERAPLSVALALNPFRRLRLDGEFAVADRLSAERASEHLSSVLWGSQEPAAQHPLRITAWTNEQGRARVRVQETTGPAELVARVDGREIWREAFSENGLIGRDFDVPLPAGKHQLELANEGVERIVLGSLRLDGLRPAPHAGGWTYGPEAVALRKGDRAALYVVAPNAVYPAGAIRYNLPPVTEASVTLADWPEGDFMARWVDPETGRPLGETRATASEGRLVLPVPAFSVEIAATLSRTAPAE